MRRFGWKGGLSKSRAALLLLTVSWAVPSQAVADVVYSFTGITGTIFPFPPSAEAFTLSSPSFLDFRNGPVEFGSTQLTSSVNCVFVSFDAQTGGGFSSQLEFADKKNNTVVVYKFPEKAFTSLGTSTNDTFGDPSLVSGTLQVTTATGSAAVPEPVTGLMLSLASILGGLPIFGELSAAKLTCHWSTHPTTQQN
jgi:hypothetical protein